MKKQRVKSTSVMTYINRDSWLVVTIFIISAIITLFTTRDEVKPTKVEIWAVDNAIEVNTKKYFGKNIVIIDARDHNLYTKGHIPTAINISDLLSDTSTNSIGSIRDNEIIVYCENSSCPDSKNLAERIINAFPEKRVAVYENGFEEWNRAGRNIEKGETTKSNGNIDTNSPANNKKRRKK
jgi:rhodanese-related sulfurtransferase